MRVLAVILFFVVFNVIGVAQSSKPAAPKTKTPSPSQPSREKIEWEKAIAVTDQPARTAALKKFVGSFPRSEHLAEAFELIATAEAVMADEKLNADENEAALKLIRDSVRDAPKPIPNELFSKFLSRFPSALYFRGFRSEGLEIAKVLEEKAQGNADQLADVAGFYINIEDGAEARRVAENAIKADPNSSKAYLTLGFANRVDFRLEDATAAIARSLEIAPDSIVALRGLAEMKRALGKPDEAIQLYRQIMTKVEANDPARTGLILALFDANRRDEAEAELAKSLEANPGNVILLGSVAYWYAAHNEGDKAVEFARKSIDVNPRFIWSHIALARGFLIQGKPVNAEKTLLAARQFGNFPTLEYEIASTRLAAGLYREAADELSKSFTVKDGVIRTNLGGRVPSESEVFTELIGPERRASIFAPTAADDPKNAAQLKALLELRQQLSSAEPQAEKVSTAADDFIRGEDKMKIHRQIFAASELLNKKISMPKVLEITKAALTNLDAGLDVPEAATAVMASELYESRTLAISRGEYVNVPPVPRPMLSSVLRGRLEEINGWTFYQMDDAAQAVMHLKRATAVLPVDSSYWRSSEWRLGSALAVSGNDAEALEAYVKSYKSAGPDAIRYGTIETVYKRVKGSTLGLEQLIGPNPSATPSSESVSQNVESTSENKIAVPSAVSVATDQKPATKSAIPAVVPVQRESIPVVTAQPSPVADVIEKLEERPPTSPSEFASASPMPVPTIEPEVSKTEVITGSPLTPEIQKTPVKKVESAKREKAETSHNELFPPVVITIPTVESVKAAVKAEPTSRPSPTPDSSIKESEIDGRSDKDNAEALPTPSSTQSVPQPTVEIKPCTVTASESIVTLKNMEGVQAVVVGTESDIILEGLTVTSTSPDDISLRRESIEGLKTRALFVVRSTSAKAGDYKVTFEMPCGKKEITIKVQ